MEDMKWREEKMGKKGIEKEGKWNGGSEEEGKESRERRGKGGNKERESGGKGGRRRGDLTCQAEHIIT